MKNVEMLQGLRVGVVLLAVVRFTLSVPDPAQAAPGDLDPTFGSGGKVTTDFGGGDEVRGLALQPDGKIIAAGFSSLGPSNIPSDLARYNADGSLDASFGSGGKVSTASRAGTFALALQPDGKIVVAGGVLARYNPDGSLDPTFGSGGKVNSVFDGAAFGLTFQADGKIVAGGESGGNFALARYTVNGSLDASFGNGGKVTTDFGGEDRTLAVAMQPDGKIVAGGEQVSIVGLPGPITFVGNFALARYNPNGSLDVTFGTGGKVITDFGGNDLGVALALQPDGKIILAGSSRPVPLGNRSFALARYNPDGSLDPTFGSGGKVTTDFGGPGGANAVALQADGKIVLAGVSEDSFALARYNSDGSLDATFGTGGKVTTDFGKHLVGVHALALQPDGKIVLAGVSENDFALARYRGDPTLFLALAANKTAFAPGETLTLTTRMANSGPDTTVDQYLGALLPPSAGPAFGCPANDAVAFVTETLGLVLTCLSAPPQTFPPFARNITIPADLPMTVTPNVFSVAWPAGAPPGPYVVFDAFIRSGSVADGSLDAGDLPALGTAAVQFIR